MKALVVYSSKTGFTQKYAEWIAEELKCRAVRREEAGPELCRECDVIVYGGNVTAGIISGLDKIRQNPDIKEKKLVVFAVGATSMNSKETIAKIKADNLEAKGEGQIPFFYFQGGIAYEKLGFVSRGILKMVYKSIKKKTDRTPEETENMKVFESSGDYTRKEYVAPLTAWVNKIESE